MQVRYLERKLKAVEKLLRPDDTLAAADIEVERTTRHHRQGEIFRAEINLRATGGNFRAEAYGESVTVAIDAVKDEIVRQVTQKKDQFITSRKRAPRKLKEGLRSVAL